MRFSAPCRRYTLLRPCRNTWLSSRELFNFFWKITVTPVRPAHSFTPRLNYCYRNITPLCQLQLIGTWSPMGRQAHTLRHVFGLSSTTPPDWPALESAWMLVEPGRARTSVNTSAERTSPPPEQSNDQNSQLSEAAQRFPWAIGRRMDTPYYMAVEPTNDMAYGRVYDAKGRPVNNNAMREKEWKRVEAMNLVMSLSMQWFGNQQRDQSQDQGREQPHWTADTHTNEELRLNLP